MAFAAVFGLMGKFETLIWLVIFVFYGVMIAKKTQGRHFLHAFLTSVVNGVWIGIIHGAFYSTYAANNPDFVASYERMPHLVSAPVTIVCFVPIFGAIFGLLSGLIAWIAGRVMKNTYPPASNSLS